MTWKKFLGALVLGTFMFDLPAANFDVPFKNIASADFYKDRETARKNYEKARENYEYTRKRYEHARSRGASDKELRLLRMFYEAARQEYREARRAYEAYR